MDGLGSSNSKFAMEDAARSPGVSVSRLMMSACVF